MIVAGIGCRAGVGEAQVMAAIETALGAHGLEVSSLSALATAGRKQAEEAIFATGRTLSLPVLLVDDAALRAVSFRALTNSSFSMATAGTPSVSETAALAAAGQFARLLGPRTVLGPVTCAIAEAST